MKFLLVALLLLPIISLSAKEEAGEDTNSTTTQQQQVEAPLEPMRLEDTSGMSVEEIRQKANAKDKKAQKVNKIFRLEQRWEDLSPLAQKNDWLQTYGGEWFKGTIKGMYNDEIEFDSDEVGLYTFKLKDVAKIKSAHIIDVNIEKVAIIPGLLRLDGDELHIIQGEDTYTFARNQIVSFSPSAERERYLWSGKITVSVDFREGNKNSLDFNTKANLKRRTAKTRFLLDYIGRFSQKNKQDTANDHRINGRFDMYQTRHYYLSPAVGEYYKDEFQNILYQVSYGVGAGYTVIDTAKTKWEVSIGPGWLWIQYSSVKEGVRDRISSPALEASTRLEYELSKITDLKYQYKLTLTKKEAGLFKHHMVLTMENEIIKNFDFDISAIWDRVDHPVAAHDGTIPLRDDYQLLFGIGIEF